MDDDYNRMEELLPALDNRIRNSEVTKLTATKYYKMPATYKPVQKCFAKHLSIPEDTEHPGSQVIDTHLTQVIQGLKPDLSIVGAERPRVTATGMIVAVEIKVGSLTRDSFGQLYCYLKGIEQAQPFSCGSCFTETSSLNSGSFPAHTQSTFRMEKQTGGKSWSMSLTR